MAENADGSITEDNKPQNAFGATAQTTGQPTTANLYRGVLAGTGIEFNNNDLAHACDLRFAISLNSSLGELLSGLVPNFGVLFKAMQAGQNDAAKFIRGQISVLISQFRLAVKGIQAALNLDASGEFSRMFSQYKKLITTINEYIKQAAQIAYDISFVVSLVNYIKAIIAWIEQLPAYMKKLLENCLSQFKNSLTNISTQIQQAAHSITTIGPAAVTAMLAQATTQQTAAQGQSNFSDSITQAITNPLSAGTTALANSISSLVSSANATLSSSRSNTKTAGP